MKIFSLVLLLLLKVYFSSAQQATIDSLKHELTIAKEDTNKVNLLSELSGSYSWYYADTGVVYAQRALDLAEELNYEDGIRRAQSNMSAALTTLGNYPLALNYAFKSLSLAEKNHDTIGIIFSNLRLALPYRELGDYKNSLVCSQKALYLAESIHLKQINFPWGHIASVYEKNNQSDSAIKYAKKAYEIDKTWSGILCILGNAYAKKSNYDSAMFYYRAGLPAAVLNHTEIDLIDIYNGIAIVQKAKGNTDSVAWYSKKALAEKVGKTYPLGLLRSANMLADFYQSQNKADSTLKYLRTAISLKDSLFNREKTMAIQNLEFQEKEKQKEIESSKLKYQNRLKMYSLLGGLLALLVIAVILLRNNRHKQKAFTLLQKQKLEIDLQKSKVEKTLDELKTTQSQLIQQEKMASLGELTAGIAHEIQNPLNFVNNFSDVSTELVDEMNAEIDKGNTEDAKLIAQDLKQNLEKINHHGKRAGDIVKGMLQHSRSSSGVKEPTNINALADEYLRLAYHGLLAKDKSFNATMKTDFDESIGKMNIIPQDIGRVILNLINNAFYAVAEKKKSPHPLAQHPAEKGGENYEPVVTVTTRRLGSPSGDGGKVEVRVKDNGNGIPQKILDKIFQPFFTTKPTGQGTGLGLSLAYDILKAHGGEIKVETKEGEGSEFIISLPVNT